MRIYLTVFASVLLAEPGDKTQLATLVFATTPGTRAWGIFCAAALALIVSTAVAVLIGSHVERWISPPRLKVVAGVAFVLIGVWMLLDRR
jgi:putative Ca2+/H+ antiporter (TMEM165/GDT1 family)